MEYDTYGIGVCRHCSQEFDKRTTIQVYCSPGCRWNWWWAEKQRRQPLRTPDPRACAACGDLYIPRSERQRCCSVDCGQSYFSAARSLRIRRCAHCDREFLASRRVYCSRRCQRFARVLRSGHTRGIVYFVQAERGGPIKIGRTEDNPSTRLALLQNGNPNRLVIRALAQGGQRYEQQLHQRFASHRLVGEWFAPCDELVALVEEYAAAQMRLAA